MNQSNETVAEVRAEPTVQSRDQLVPQVRDDSRPAAAILHEQLQDGHPNRSSGMYVP